MSQVLEVTDNTFEQEVLKSDIPVLVDIWAPWCGPCLALAPVIEELAGEFEGKAKVVKLNADENVKTAQELRIAGIPSLILFSGGSPVEMLVGAHKKGTIAEMLNKQLAG